MEAVTPSCVFLPCWFLIIMSMKGMMRFNRRKGRDAEAEIRKERLWILDKLWNSLF